MHDDPHWRFYGSATVGRRGQIEIPARAREALHISDGDKIAIVDQGDGRVTLISARALRSLVRRTERDLARQQGDLRDDGNGAGELTDEL